MNTITSVRRALVLLMLCSELFHATFATRRLRFFSDVSDDEKTKTKITGASEKCKGNDETLVTVYDEEDAKFMDIFTLNGYDGYPVRPIWLGLRFVGNYTWSNGDPVIFNQSSVKLEKGEQKCEAIDVDQWQSFNCAEKKFFMCSKGNVYTLHHTKKTWCQALQHCRNTHSELVSINGTKQNDEVIKKGNGSSFWIGLRRDEWKWDDNGCSSFRGEWKYGPPNKKCTSMGLESQSVQLYSQVCSGYQHSFCVAGHVRIKVIQLNKTWEEAHDYCKLHHSRPLWINDEKDQEAVEQWLNNTDVDGPFWVGLRQSRMFGFWIWSDSVVVYSNWRSEEPEPSMHNLCGVIDKEDKKWREEKCLEKLYFLCEEDIIYM